MNETTLLAGAGEAGGEHGMMSERRWRERFLLALAWRLPRAVVYWAVIRAAGQDGPVGGPTDYPGERTAEQMLKAWG